MTACMLSALCLHKIQISLQYSSYFSISAHTVFSYVVLLRVCKTSLPFLLPRATARISPLSLNHSLKTNYTCENVSEHDQNDGKGHSKCAETSTSLND